MAATVAHSQPTGIAPPSVAPPAISSVQSHLAHSQSHHHSHHINHKGHHPGEVSKAMPEPLPPSNRFQPSDFKLVRTLGTGQ
jgi:hypothetical protein